MPRFPAALGAILSAILLTSAPAPAQPASTFRAGSLTIEAPWSRATPGGAKIGAGYMRIVNRGVEPDRLIGGTASAAARVSLHGTTNSDGVSRMRPLEGGLVIPAGGTVNLAPGGLHVMLEDLTRPLKQGETVDGTLAFEKAGTVAITYRVGGIGARSAGGEHHHH